MGRVDADCVEGWHYSGGSAVVKAVFKIFISRDSKGALGKSVYSGKFYRKCVWPGVGGYASGITGDGRAFKAGGRQEAG